MAKIKKLDWLAQRIIDVLEEQGLDAPYIEDIKDTLGERDRFAVLLWCNNLDSGNTEALAKRLNVSHEELSVTVKTLQKL